jgi:predicted acyl esterase
MKLVTLLLIATALLPGVSYAERAASTAQDPDPRALTYIAALRQSDVRVPARDGVLLATDIYRPANAGAATSERLPVLLHRTPYDKSEPATVAIAETLARHGYVVIVQDTRGRHPLNCESSTQ